MSDRQLALKAAVERGYYIDADGFAHNGNGEIIKGYVNSTGYKCITIRMDKYFGRRKCCKVPMHRLMAYQKFGEQIFDEELEIRHLNNNKLDNSFNNIGIGTPTENRHDLPEEEILRVNKIAAKARRRLSEDEVKIIKIRHEAGDSYKKLIADYGIAKSTLSYIINNKTYSGVEL